MDNIVYTLALAAKAAGVPPALLLSLCFAESNFRNVVVPHDGHSASYGVCQMKANTARWVANRYNLQWAGPSSLLEPSQNAVYAAHYLHYQIRRYRKNQDCAVDAYNKGTCVSGQSEYVRKVRRIQRRKEWLL
jgi:soluble lytic murein transglycosylase-like protein